MDEELEEIKRKKMEKLIRRLNDPKTKAKEFARAILECNEYKNFMKYFRELQANPTAQNLLRQFRQKQMELRWNGFDPNTLEELRDLQMEINKNEIIQNFVKTQQELLGILRITNSIISEKIGVQFALFQGGGCCG